ncbi:TIR domain-containing protein [Leptothoe spongobia]|uniref:TIR domain-containing protein n=1 Tax=Leptothoe spongobia TAU-MAC 1115 TaxID=1967444 RepID=A0A947DF45_9CYAN|nr:TIR domain-containing protein [Leptothoe spongobia]MBT9315887.1 TIR domain-containing protein [Leptothoe spongobia TAU-MAC 1115]
MTLPSSSLQDIFISYGRADSRLFARQVKDCLVEAGLSVWFDFDDIPLGVDYQNQISDGIEKADNFLFIISPHSVNSPYCAKEIELALAFNKRIIPLLHVEEISYEAWQQRNPDASEFGWQSLKEKGVHSSFPNMHPEISKINWVYFREGVDDFDAGMTGLKTILARHKSYVRQHTQLLVQALTWQRQQRQPSQLITEDTLAEANVWLNTRFKEDQSPCLPTDLHCEFIAESLKGANDQMIQIFVSYSEEDIAIQEKVRKRLMREGFTVWVNTVDIPTTTDFQLAINRGIEKADNIVFLLSPSSLASQYCQQELAYARRYHKRIIPLLVRSMDVAKLPTDLRMVQFIDFSSLASEIHFDRAVDELIRILRSSADYVDLHKRFLVRALVWERQGRDRKFLLRSSDFTMAQTWLSESSPVGSEPTDLHTAFIKASQGINQFYDAFISYGRVDSKAFATDLCQQLNNQGFQIWFDQNDIPLGVDFQEQINDGIEKSHNFIFIISPHSVNSPYCGKEIALALKYNKRIIPILQVEEIGYTTWKERNPGSSPDRWKTYKAQGKHSSFFNMHPDISKINWLNARAGVDDLTAAVNELVTLCRHHGDYVQQHTELLIGALAWERHQNQASYLLMGEDRLRAQTWLLTEFSDEQPPCKPSLLQANFITESIKTADGGMTQVFISYSEEDLASKEIVRYHLLQAGITVWTNTVDIRMGEDFEMAIQRGIEEADNVVYLISQASLESEYCQMEIDQALDLHKRIIPMLIEDVDLTQIPDTIRKLQFINLTDNQVSIDLEKDLAELLRSIRRDAPYHNQHKRLLVRALKWERQKCNPSLLLQRRMQDTYFAWAQNAKNRTLGGALPLQLAFLEASQQQSPDQTLGVFFIHHIDDCDFSQRLNDTLLIQGKSCWLSPDGAAGETERWDDTQQLVDNAENVLFVLSPSSVRCDACIAQLSYAQSRQKRVLPVVYRDVVKSSMPEDISSLPWSDFRRHGGDFLVNFGELFRTLESEPYHVRSHTRLLVKAAEWDAAQRDDSFLLRGNDLADSERWLQQTKDKVPPVTDLQKTYIKASQALPFKKIKARYVALATMATTLAVSAISLFGGLQSLETRAYDQFLRWRPNETEQDERLLIVKVDSPSGEWLRKQIIEGRYEPGIGTIPEDALSEAIRVLNSHDARLIGLDVFRDFPAQGALSNDFAWTDNLFGICQTASDQVSDIGNDGIPLQRVGFANLLLDGGKIVRRHYLTQWAADGSPCVAEESFTLLLAKAYLESEDIAVDIIVNSDHLGEYIESIVLGDVVPPALSGDGTAYHTETGESTWKNLGSRDWSTLDGRQTLLNFWTFQDPNTQEKIGARLKDFAQQVSLEAVIKNEVDPGLIRDRIILIGYTDFSDRNSDDFNTPYGDSVPGIYLHGQMISQLINAVLEERPLIRWWPFVGEVGWVLLWSGVGGFVFWRFVRPGPLLAAGFGAVGLLTLACYGFMVGPVIWVPWVPALVGWGITGSAVGYMTYRLRKG